GRAVEPDAVGERPFQLRGGHGDRLEVAEHVGEPQPHEADVAFLERAEDELLLPIHASLSTGPRRGTFRVDVRICLSPVSLGTACYADVSGGVTPCGRESRDRSPGRPGTPGTAPPSATWPRPRP